MSYDTASRVTAATDANLKTLQLAYNLMDQLTATSQTVGGVTLTTTAQHDLDGNAISYVDRKNQTWQGVITE